MRAEHLRVVGEALLPAIAYGDAAGLPTETKSAGEIAQRYRHIDQLIAPRDNPYYPGDFPAGTTSDDTQLSVAVAEALIASDGFDIKGQAAEHLRVYQSISKVLDFKGEMSVRGWGGSTTASMERLAQGVSPAESGEKDGAGNGILMKMMPLIHWQVARGINDQKRHEQYDQLTNLTHDSDVARACTRLHGDVVCWLLEHPGVTMDEFRAYALSVIAHEPMADPKSHITSAMTHPLSSLEELVARYATGQNDGHYGFFVPNTIAMAYDVFVAAGGEYEKAIWLAVNLGGDTDSIASIAGSMCSAWSGGNFAKPADFERVEGYDRLARLSREFAKKALSLA